MKHNVNFRRNVYVILICILIFGIITQVARSNWMLKYTSYDSEYIIRQFNDLQQHSGSVSYELHVPEGDYHCLVYNSEDALSAEYYNNFTQVYLYLNQHYTVQDVKENQAEFTACKAVVLLTSIEDLDDELDQLEQYIYKGGHLFLGRMDNPSKGLEQIYRKLGIVNYRYLIANNEIEFLSDILIGQNEQIFKGDYIYNDSLLLELDSDVEMLARGNQAPLIWRTNYGEGNILVYNGNNLNHKTNRGLITGAISIVVPDYIYPIFNAKLFYIDDYPAPMSHETNEKIAHEYHRTMSSFYKNIWWPDMISLSKRHNIKYTAVAILDYNDVIEAPFPTYRQEDLMNMILYGREVLKLDGEVGIHGYNHQPLQFDQEIADYFEYETWASYEDMEHSIREVVSYLKMAFPNYDPVSYVPPSNILSELGRQALVDNWDSIKVIASLYEADEFNYSYVQEFDIAPDGVIEMPRITSGYTDTEEMRWLEASVMTSHGFFSHFIHPDDIFDDYRSGDKGWGELKIDFEDMLERVDHTYPWLQSRTSGEAALQVAATLQNEVTRQYEQDRLVVSLHEETTEQFFILRTDKKIGKLQNCDVNKIYEGIYLVTATGDQFNIQLK